jgi:release factor glutamine methyltransferase
VSEAVRWLGRPSDGPPAGISLRDVLEDATGLFARAGIAEPHREALMLLSTVAGTSPGTLWMRRDQPADPEILAALAGATARRAAGAPAAYATGAAAFRTLDLAVQADVLIPRPETEGLVEHVLAWSRATGRWGTVVDVGTGSGCVALSLAVEGHYTRVVATDICERALAVARRNAAAVAPRAPVEFREGDLLWALGAERADVIVSNPPYVTAGEWEALEPGVREYEPRLALVGGADGLGHMRALLRHARGRLEPGGLLALELDCRRADRTLALARAEGWTSARVERDLFGRERYLLAEWEA